MPLMLTRQTDWSHLLLAAYYRTLKGRCQGFVEQHVAVEGMIIPNAKT